MWSNSLKKWEMQKEALIKSLAADNVVCEKIEESARAKIIGQALENVASILDQSCVAFLSAQESKFDNDTVLASFRASLLVILKSLSRELMVSDVLLAPHVETFCQTATDWLTTQVEILSKIDQAIPQAEKEVFDEFYGADFEAEYPSLKRELFIHDNDLLDKAKQNLLERIRTPCVHGRYLSQYLQQGSLINETLYYRRIFSKKYDETSALSVTFFVKFKQATGLSIQEYKEKIARQQLLKPLQQVLQKKHHEDEELVLFRQIIAFLKSLLESPSSPEASNNLVRVGAYLESEFAPYLNKELHNLRDVTQKIATGGELLDRPTSRIHLMLDFYLDVVIYMGKIKRRTSAPWTRSTSPDIYLQQVLTHIASRLSYLEEVDSVISLLDKHTLTTRDEGFIDKIKIIVLLTYAHYRKALALKEGDNVPVFKKALARFSDQAKVESWRHLDVLYGPDFKLNYPDVAKKLLTQDWEIRLVSWCALFNSVVSALKDISLPTYFAEHIDPLLQRVSDFHASLGADFRHGPLNFEAFKQATGESVEEYKQIIRQQIIIQALDKHLEQLKKKRSPEARIAVLTETVRILYGAKETRNKFKDTLVAYTEILLRHFKTEWNLFETNLTTDGFVMTPNTTLQMHTLMEAYLETGLFRGHFASRELGGQGCSEELLACIKFRLEQLGDVEGVIQFLSKYIHGDSIRFAHSIDSFSILELLTSAYCKKIDISPPDVREALYTDLHIGYGSAQALAESSLGYKGTLGEEETSLLRRMILMYLKQGEAYFKGSYSAAAFFCYLQAAGLQEKLLQNTKCLPSQMHIPVLFESLLQILTLPDMLHFSELQEQLVKIKDELSTNTDAGVSAQIRVFLKTLFRHQYHMMTDMPDLKSEDYDSLYTELEFGAFVKKAFKKDQAEWGAFENLASYIQASCGNDPQVKISAMNKFSVSLLIVVDALHPREAQKIKNSDLFQKYLRIKQHFDVLLPASVLTSSEQGFFVESDTREITQSNLTSQP